MGSLSNIIKKIQEATAAIHAVFPTSFLGIYPVPDSQLSPNNVIKSVINLIHNVFVALEGVTLHRGCSFILPIFFILLSFLAKLREAHILLIKCCRRSKPAYSTMKSPYVCSKYKSKRITS